MSLHRDERGAAYSLSVVLILPMYIAYIALTIEFVLLMNSNQALTCATQSAVHTARAWTMHRDALNQDGQTLELCTIDAVSQTMLPFATSGPSNPHHRDETLETLLRDSGMSESAIHRYSNKSAQLRDRLHVRIQRETRETEGFSVTIGYDSPLWIPFFEPILATGRRHGQPVRTIVTQAWVPMASCARSMPRARTNSCRDPRSMP